MKLVQVGKAFLLEPQTSEEEAVLTLIAQGGAPQMVLPKDCTFRSNTTVADASLQQAIARDH